MISISLVVIILSGLWAITGSWPPLVVVESNSMIHSEDGEIGAIDAGDLILVTAPERADRIIEDKDRRITGHRGSKKAGWPPSPSQSLREEIEEGFVQPDFGDAESPQITTKFTHNVASGYTFEGNHVKGNA